MPTPKQVTADVAAFMDAADKAAARTALEAAAASDLAAKQDALGFTPLEATEAAILAEIGTDGRIKAELLPETQEVAAISFADGSALALSEGRFTGGADGLIYRHNGVDVGGIPYAPDAYRTVKRNIQYPAWVQAGQMMAAGLIGDVTNAESLATVFTSAATGTLNIPVPVLVGDKPFQYAEKIVTAWNANSTFATYYEASALGSLLQVQSKTAGENDTTRTFSVPAGTSGITTKASSLSAPGQHRFLEIARFPMLASEAVVGQKFSLNGSILIHSPAGTTATFSLAMLPAGYSAAAVLSNFGAQIALTRNTSGLIYSDLEFKSVPLKLVASGSGFVVSGAAASVGTSAFRVVWNKRFEIGTSTFEHVSAAAFGSEGTQMLGYLSAKGELILALRVAIDLAYAGSIGPALMVDLKLDTDTW